jgi:hypothetical protein
VKAELRAITNNHSNLDSAVVRSSEMPSEKYSWAWSSDMLSKGSTAIEGLAGAGTWPVGRLETLTEATRYVRTGSTMFRT